MDEEEHYFCTICGDVWDLNEAQMVEHFDTVHPFLSALVQEYSRFDLGDPRGWAWLN